MTEEQIEVAVSRKIDRLDARFINSSMTQQEYDEAVREIDAWADVEYRLCDRSAG